jgi:large subunit ribosomal protein L46
VLVQSGGVDMNTWVVGGAPVGYMEFDHRKPVEKDSVTQVGAKTFFMRARMMAGQANLEQNKLGLADFKWLAKEEVRKVVSPHYWASVRNMLPDR